MGACIKSSYCNHLNTNICCYDCKRLKLHNNSECNMDSENGQCRIFNAKFVKTPEGKCDYCRGYSETNIVTESYVLNNDNFICPYHREYVSLETVVPCNYITPCENCSEFTSADKRTCDNCWKGKRNIFSINYLTPVSHEDCWSCTCDFVEDNDTDGINPNKWECKNFRICKRCYEIGLKCESKGDQIL